MPSYRRPHAVTARELAVWTDDPLVVLMIGVAAKGYTAIHILDGGADHD